MYYLNDRKKSKYRKYILGILFLVFLFFIFFIFVDLGNFIHFIGKPFWKSKNYVSENIENSSNLKTKKIVFNENKNLKNENEYLKNKMLDYEVLKNENIYLKELLNRVENPNSYILARVLVKPNKSPYDTLIIDIGKENVFNGQKVFAEGFPIGEIVEIYSDTSLVKLYSSPNEVTQAEIDTLGVSVELLGRGGGNFEMDVPKDLDVPKDSFVILPQLNSKIIAIVVKTISEEKDPINKIILKTPVNINELKWVQIIK